MSVPLFSESEAQSRTRLLIAAAMACLLALVALFGMVKIAWAQGRDTAGIWFALGAIGDSIGSIFCIAEDLDCQCMGSSAKVYQFVSNFISNHSHR